jgi:hypothetical protein
MVELYRAYFHSHFQDGIVLFAAVLFYTSISDESPLANFLRLLSIIFVFISWLLAPVIFSPFPTRDSLYDDINEMLSWIRQPFKKGEFLRVNESENRSQMASFWTKQEQLSWQGWFMKNIYVDMWDTTDRWFNTPLNILIWYGQQAIFLLWRYLPWVILAWFYYDTESVYYALTIVVLIIALFSIEKFMRNVHDYFTLLKTLPVFLLPPLILFYQYGKLTFIALLQSMFMYVLAVFVVIEVALGLWNFVGKVRVRTFFTSPHNNNTSKQQRLVGWRLFIPLMFFKPQIIWPYITLVILTIGNFFTIAFSGAVTAFLYNGRVSDKWSRAYVARD